jgi:hypothetical protein
MAGRMDDAMDKKDTGDDLKRISAQVPVTWIRRIDEWRRHQEDIPSISESIRRLVDIAIDSQDTKKYRR